MGDLVTPHNVDLHEGLGTLKLMFYVMRGGGGGVGGTGTHPKYLYRCMLPNRVMILELRYITGYPFLRTLLAQGVIF